MRVIASILLLAVFVRHGAIYRLADASGFTPAAMSYMLGGLEEAVFAAVVAVMLLVYHRNVWRNLALWACAIAALEGFQMAGCRALITDIRSVPDRTDLCSHLVGFPVWPVFATAYLVIVCYALASTFRKR